MQFRSSSTSSADDVLTFDIAQPAGTQEGDVLIAAVISESVNTGFNTPSGWRRIASNPSGAAPTPNPHTVAIFRKEVGASETGPYTFNIAGSLTHSLAGGIACYSNATGTYVDTHEGVNDGQVGSTSIPAPDVTTTAANALVARIFSSGNVTVTADSAGLEARNRFDVIASTSQRRLHYCDEDQAVAGATGVETATAGAARAYTAFTISMVAGTPGVLETLAADAILAQSNLTGVLTDQWLVS